ncbi:MAG: Gfo/Idh/MocA family oxidoreductase [Clostridiales bacterium]|nr:Gfo/Idh/MocA family oxidoreductase [Clostridiales bacterium]
MSKIKVGVVGCGQRAMGLIYTMLACEEAEIVAVCDIVEEKRIAAVKRVEEVRKTTPKSYADYEDLLKDENVQAVVICSSWEEHIRMAIRSMKAGKITAMEVGCSYDLEECWELVRTYEETKTPIMMMENCCFDKFELLSTSLARAGKFGEIVFAHGAYSHDLRFEMLENNYNYRLGNYLKRNCENYPTHELGPIAKLLDVNRGNRMVSLVSVASKAAGLKAVFNQYEKGKAHLGDTVKQGDIVTTIITCANGEVITLTLDTTLPKHYSREFTVRGTKGYAVQEANMVLFDCKELHDFAEPHKSLQRWIDNGEDYKAYLPDCWRNITQQEMELGHGGMDYMMFKAFFHAAIHGEPMPVDVYDAASWLAVSSLSEQSIAQGGAPQAFPDFTKGKWISRSRLDVVDFPTVADEE